MVLKTMRRVSALVLCLCFVVVFVAEAGTPRKTITLKIGGGHPSNTMAYTAVAQSVFQTRLKERAAAEANVDIEWIEAYGGTIAKLGEALTACQDGLLDVFVSSFAFDNMKLFLMNMPFYVPFSAPDPVLVTKAARQVYNEHKEVYDELWGRYNQKFLAFGPTGQYELISNFPVTTMTDLQGHKIAAAGANLPWLEGSGAVPVQSNLNEAYTSIQTGVYEGWIMWPDSSYRFKLHEVAKYYTMVGFGADPVQGMSINLDVWNSFSPELQKIVEEVALEYEEKCCETARQWDQEALEKMRAEGAIITTLDPAERDKWIQGLPDIPQIRADEATGMGFPGTALWNSYIKAQQDLGYEFPREWVVK